MTRAQTDQSPSAEGRADALMRITQAIETAGTLDELLRLALRQLTERFDVGHGGVALLDESGTVGQVVCEYPPQPPGPSTIQLGDLPNLQRALRTRQPLQVNDIDYQN